MSAFAKRTYTTMGIDPRLGPKAPPPSIQFPMFLFLLAIASLSGAYYFLFVVSPMPLSELGEGDGLGSILCAGMERIVVPIAANPLVALGIFVGLLLPGLIDYRRSRQYYLSLVLGSFIIGGTALVFIGNPAQEIGGAIQTFIESSSRREFPSALEPRTR